jgi:UDP-glucose 4-epimerase
MKIIITGVAGFIGSQLCNELINNGHNVIGIDNLLCGYIENMNLFIKHNNFKFYNISINDPEIYNLIQKNDIVIHLAAISSLASNQENPSFSYQNNVTQMLYLLEACRNIGVKHFIFSSTSAVYENNTNFPLTENDQIKPNLIYSLEKKHCEELIESFNQVYGLQYSILRFFNIYGPNQDSQRLHPALVPYLLKCIINNETPILHSDGNQQRDYVFIDDVISLFKILIFHEPLNDTINLSSGSVISVKEIVNILNSFSDYQLNPIYRNPELLWEKSTKLWQGEYPFLKDRMRQEVEKYTVGDNSKAYELLGWKPLIDMKTGLKKCFDFVNK